MPGALGMLPPSWTGVSLPCPLPDAGLSSLNNLSFSGHFSLWVVCGRALNFPSALYFNHTLSLLGATVGPAVGTSGPEHGCAAVALTSPEKYLLPFTNRASSAPILNADLRVCVSEEFLSSKMLGAAALFCLTHFPPKSPGSVNPLCPCFPSALPLPLSKLSHIFQRLRLPFR